MVPDLERTSAVAPPPNTDARLVPYGFLAWLVLPALVAPPDEHPLQPLLWRYVVDATRLGAALTALLSRFHVDVTPCTASVARARIKAAATSARLIDAAPFTVLAADWYVVQIAPVGLALAPPAQALPPDALFVRLGHVLGEANDLEVLGLLEGLVGARVTHEDRCGANSPFELLFTVLAEHAFPRMPASMAALRTGEAMGKELGRLLLLAVPDTFVARYEPELAGIMALAERLYVATGSRTAPRALAADDLATAVGHMPTHTLALNGGGLLPSPELARGVALIDRALGHDGQVDLPRLVANEAEVHYLEDRMSRSDVPTDATGRVTLLCGLLSDARDARLATRAGGSGGAGDGDAVGLPTGYPRVHDRALQLKINGSAFLELAADIARRLGSPGRDGHPHQIIRFILQSREIIFIHALMGRKKSLLGVSVVERVYLELGVKHGGSYAGEVAFLAFLPPPVAGVPRPHPPTLTALWKDLVVDCNIDLDYVNRLLFACVAMATASVPSETVAEIDVFARLPDLQALIQPLENFLDGFGWTDHGSGIAVLLNKGIQYLTFNNQHRVPLHRARVATCIHLVLQEASAVRHAVCVKGDDPTSNVTARIIQENSPGFGQLESYIAESAMGMHQQHMYALYIAPGLAKNKQLGGPTTGGSPIEERSGDEPAKKTRAEKKREAKAKAAAEAEETVKAEAAKSKPGRGDTKLAVGALSAKFVARDGDTILIGNKTQPRRHQGSLKEFYATEGVPKFACAGCWLSSHDQPEAFCDLAEADPSADAAVKAEHATATSKAHTVPSGWRAANLSRLLKVVMIASAQGMRMPTAPAAAPRVGSTLLGPAAVSPAHYTRASPVQGAAHLAPRAVLAPWLPLGTPLRGVGSVYYVPVALDAQRRPLVGVPRAEPSSLFGAANSTRAREGSLALANGWARALFPHRADVHPTFLFAERAQDQDDPTAVGHAVGSVSTVRDLLVQGEASTTYRSAVWAATLVKWLPLGQVISTNRWAGLAAAAVARLLGFAQPVDDTFTRDFKLGAMDPQLVPPKHVRHATRATPMLWSEAVEKANHTCALLEHGLDRDICLAQAKAEALEAARPPGDPEVVEAHAVAEDMRGWRLAVARGRFAEIDHATRASCYFPDDARLAHLPYPEVLARVKSDHLDPMPSPPPPGIVPPGTRGWNDGFKRWARVSIRRFNREMRGLMTWMVGVAAGTIDPAVTPRPTVQEVRLGTDAMEPWLAAAVNAGYVIEASPDGGLRVRDASVTPPTHLNRDYMAEMAQESEDYALWDCLLTHGVCFLADLPPQVILMRPLLSLEQGVLSVHSELARLIELGWYERVPIVVSGDDGDDAYDCTVPSCPCRCVKQGSADRAGPDQGRFRRLVDNGADHGTHLTVRSEEPTVSMNSRCSVKRHTERVAIARHTPAIRRPTLTPSSQWKPAGRVQLEHPVAPPPVLQGRAARRVAKGLPPYAATPPYVTWGQGVWSFPPELKAMLMEILIAVCILAHAAMLAGEPLIGFGDDHKDFFHQFVSMVAQRFATCMHALDPAAVAAGDLDAILVAIIEKCMSMGTSPASNWAQRFSTEHTLYFCRRFNERELPILQAMARDVPAFARWFEARRQLADTRDVCQWWVLVIFVWTDDPLGITFGVPRALRAVHDWGVHIRKLGVIRSKVHKRELGVHLTHIGGRLFLPGLLAHVTEAKQNKVVEGLDIYLRGAMRVAEYRQLLGLLNHLVCLLAMPYTVMYGMYEAMDAARETGGDETSVLAPLTPRAVKSATRWRAAACSRLGCSALTSVFESRPPMGTMRIKLHSDAAKKGEGKPGIAGNFYSYVWVLAFVGANAKYNEMPIVATEFIAGALLNILVFGPRLVGLPVTLVMDALVASRVMASHAGGAPLMQYLHELMTDMPEYQDLSADLACSQEWGPSNCMCDAWSRDKGAVAEDIMRALGMTPTYVALPERAFAILDAALFFFRHGEPDPRVTGLMLHGPRYRSDPEGDGPPLLLVLAALLTVVSAAALTVDATASPPLAVDGDDDDDDDATQHGSDTSFVDDVEDGVICAGCGFDTSQCICGFGLAGTERTCPAGSGRAHVPRSRSYSAHLTTRVLVLLALACCPRVLAAEVTAGCVANASAVQLADAGTSAPPRVPVSPAVGVRLAQRGVASRDDACEDLYALLRAARDGTLADGPAVTRLLQALGASRITTGTRSAFLAALEAAAAGTDSDVSGAAFCASRGASLATFKRWRAKLLRLLEACDQLDYLLVHVVDDVGEQVRDQHQHARRVADHARSTMCMVARGVAHAATWGRAFSSDVAGDGAPSVLDWLGGGSALDGAATAVTVAPCVHPLDCLGGGSAPSWPQTAPPAVSRRAVAHDSVLGHLGGVAHHVVAPPPAPDAEQRAALPQARGAAVILDALRNDTSPLALCPGRPEELEQMVGSVHSYLASAYAASTRDKDAGYWRFWESVCNWLGTSPWRTDVAANTGQDGVGYMREQILQCIALIRKYVTMKPRSHASPHALPSSAFAMVDGARRVHTAAGLTFAPSTMAKGVLKGMLREYVRVHRVDAVAPSRKCPFPHEAHNNVLRGLLNAPEGAAYKGATVRYASYHWLSARACFEMLAESGNRGDEARRFAYSSLVWKVSGVEVVAPTAAQLHGLDASRGDGVWLKHSTSKSDPFGFFFGTTPTFMAYSATAPRNACRRLAELELAALQAGLDAAARGRTPLFGPTLGAAFTYEQMASTLRVFLVCGAGVPPADLAKYSVHSFRITVATLLAAAKCPIDKIKRLLRWRGDESVTIYARLSDGESAEWTRKTLSVHVDSRVAPRLVTVPIDININVGGEGLEAAIDADVAATVGA